MWNGSQEQVQVLVWITEPLLRAGVLATLAEGRRIRLLVNNAALGGDVHRATVVVSDWSAGLQLVQHSTDSSVPRLPTGSQVLVVAAHTRTHAVASALQAGIRGVVRSSCTSEELVQAILTVAEGATYVSPSLAQRLAESVARERLTAREREVLSLLARGHCNKAIARQLDIAVGTVKTHVKGILVKLNAASRTEAACLAAGNGLVELADFSTMRSFGSTVSLPEQHPWARTSEACAAA